MGFPWASPAIAAAAAGRSSGCSRSRMLVASRSGSGWPNVAMKAGLTRWKWPSRVLIQNRSSERTKKGSTGGCCGTGSANARLRLRWTATPWYVSMLIVRAGRQANGLPDRRLAFESEAYGKSETCDRKPAGWKVAACGKLRAAHARVSARRSFSPRQLPLLPDGPRADDYRVGDAGRGGRLAGVCADASPAGPRTGGAGAVSSRHPSLSRRGPDGRPFCAPTNPASMLRRLRAVLPDAVGADVARLILRVPDLWRAAIEWNRTRLQRTREPGIPAAAGDRGTLPQGSGVELIHFPGRHDCRTGGGRVALRLDYKPRTGLCLRGDRVSGGAGDVGGYPGTHRARAASSGVLWDGLGGPAIHPAQQADPGRHLAGPVRRAVGRRRGAAAGLRARDSQNRGIRARNSAERARRGRRHHGPGGDALALAAACRRDHAVVRVRLRGLHGNLWFVAQAGPFAGGISADRRVRHGECDRAPYAHPAFDAR